MLLKGASHVIDANGQVEAHCFQIGDEPRAQQSAEVEIALPALNGSRNVTGSSATEPAGGKRQPTVAPPQSAKLNTRQLLAQLRARLRDVEHEIAVRKDLETERDQIRRLIAAAKAEQNNVRRIRAAG